MDRNDKTRDKNELMRDQEAAFNSNDGELSDAQLDDVSGGMLANDTSGGGGSLIAQKNTNTVNQTTPVEFIYDQHPG